MGYIYVAMIKDKEDTRKAFNEQASKYIDVLTIIDKWLECQLHNSLHFVGYYQNPKYFIAIQELRMLPT